VETLFESELFGYVKGAFTGANQDKMGLFEYAHNGTLFLDEIGDMPMNTQAKLLRVLQNQEVQRVGSLSPRKVDARVIAATNHDLKALISQSRFREDLYYRLSMVEIRTPRLAERKEDLALLEHYFIRKFAEQYQKTIQGLTQRAQIVLARYSWPGNVRELENVLGSACMMVMSEMIDVADLPENMRPHGLDTPAAAAPGIGAEPDKDLSLEEQERLLLISALERSGGNQSQAARLLRISRDRMRYKMSKHNLK
jgi:transcriptional regulator with PAS, ATPase and Fis domain